MSTKHYSGYAWLEFAFMHDRWMFMIWKCWRYLNWEFMETICGGSDFLNTNNLTKCYMMDVAKVIFSNLNFCTWPIDHSRGLTSYGPWRSFLWWSMSAFATLRLAGKQMISFWSPHMSKKFFVFFNMF